MLDNFREIYNRELKQYDDGLERLILSLPEVRMFVYEICKVCIAFQPAVEADAQKPCRFCQSWVNYEGGNFCLHCGRRLRTA